MCTSVMYLLHTDLLGNTDSCSTRGSLEMMVRLLELEGSEQAMRCKSCHAQWWPVRPTMLSLRIVSEPAQIGTFQSKVSERRV